jgi:type IV pilus assembly protein PilY1
LDSQNVDTGRKIATWDPVTNAGAPFRWTANPAATSGIAPNTGLGLSLQTFASDTNGQDVVNYLRGSTAQEVRNGGFFRNRAHRLGDIVFSNPIYVGPPSSPNLSGSYVSFAAAHASRPGILYVGGDDGMLHAFDATTGAERFAFIPNGVFPNLIKLVSPFYNAQHRFFVDGSPRQVDVQFSDSTWHTLVLGTEGAGGNDVFAIDVSDPTLFVTESALASAVLWDFTDADMGNSFSVPTVANTSSGNVILIGNGYNSVQGKPFLYSVSAQTGNIIRKIDLCAAVPTACNLGAANGLSTAIAVNSSGQATGTANLAYAGDLQGNLWRIDISNVNPALWSVSVLAQARDPSGNPQPITTAPVATLNPKYPQVLGTMVFFATGELLGAPDLSSSQLQSIYGVYDPPAPYATPLVPPYPRVAPTASSSLVQQVLSAANIGANSVSVVTGNAVSIPTNKGWFIDLALNSGERVVNDMQLRSGALIVDSYQPSGSACGGPDSSFLYVINFATGSSFPSPQFDVTGEGSIDQGDTAVVAGNHVVPLGERLGTGYYSRPTIISDDNPTGRGVNYIAIVCGENGVCKPVPIRGPLKHRTAWWEVRQ